MAGLAIEGEGDWLTGDVGAAARRPLGRRVSLEVAAALAGFRVGAPTEYRAVILRAVPALRWHLGARSEVTLRGHGGVGRSTSGPSDGVEGGEEVEEDLTLLGGGVEWKLSAGSARLTTAGDGYDTEAGGYGVGSAGIEVPLGRGRLEAELQVWSVPGDEREEEAVFVATVTLPIGGRLSAVGAGGKSAPDPLLRTPSGSYGSALLRWEPFDPLRAPADPVASLVDADRRLVRFRLRVEAEEVAVLGDFSSWEPVALERLGGFWQLDLQLPAGVHRFGFRVDGEWHVPETAPGRAEDEWGRATATLVVPDQGGA